MLISLLIQPKAVKCFVKNERKKQTEFVEIVILGENASLYIGRVRQCSVNESYIYLKVSYSIEIMNLYVIDKKVLW